MHASKTEKEKNLTTYGVWTREDYRSSKRRIFLSRNSSLCATEQFHSDASLETVDQRAPNNLKNRQWTAEAYVITPRSTLAPHGGEWPYSFLQAIGRMLVYCYKCTNAGLVNSCTSAKPWTTCKGAFIQDPPHGKSSTAASAMGSWAQSLARWLAPSCLFKWITLQSS